MLKSVKWIVIVTEAGASDMEPIGEERYYCPLHSPCVSFVPDTESSLVFAGKNGVSC
jgi:hypothetical protein